MARADTVESSRLAGSEQRAWMKASVLEGAGVGVVEGVGGRVSGGGEVSLGGSGEAMVGGGGGGVRDDECRLTAGKDGKDTGRGRGGGSEVVTTGAPCRSVLSCTSPWGRSRPVEGEADLLFSLVVISGRVTVLA